MQRQNGSLQTRPVELALSGRTACAATQRAPLTQRARQTTVICPKILEGWVKTTDQHDASYILLVVVLERLLRRGGPFLQAAEEILGQVLGQVAELVVLVAGRFLHHAFEALDGALGDVADCTSKAGAGVLGSGGDGVRVCWGAGVLGWGEAGS